MLPENPTPSGQATHAKIIPMRRPTTARGARSAGEKYCERLGEKCAPVSARVQLANRIAVAGRRTHHTREDAARHYLKFMLPGVPVTAFVVTFLYGYLLQGMHTLVLNGHAAEQSYTPAVDATLPLIGALLVACATGMLCIAIYWGYLRISERVSERTSDGGSSPAR